MNLSGTGLLTSSPWGDLAPGELAAEDVVDAVLLRAYHEYVNPIERLRVEPE